MRIRIRVPTFFHLDPDPTSGSRGEDKSNKNLIVPIFLKIYTRYHFSCTTYLLKCNENINSIFNSNNPTPIRRPPHRPRRPPTTHRRRRPCPHPRHVSPRPRRPHPTLSPKTPRPPSHHIRPPSPHIRPCRSHSRPRPPTTTHSRRSTASFPLTPIKKNSKYNQS